MCQRDIHYNATLALCIRAGYTEKDARIIAWANFQTDCYRKTQLKWNSFCNPGPIYHFVDRDEIYRYLVMLLALGKDVKADPGWLISLGIALHTYQDSHSHAGFVGRWSKVNVMGLGRGYWFVPPYGHSQMLKHPDRCEVTWTDTRTGDVRENPYIFSESLQHVSELLSARTGIADIAQPCFEPSYDERKRKWAILAGLPGIRFSKETKMMWPRHKREFVAAAERQKEFLK